MDLTPELDNDNEGSNNTEFESNANLKKNQKNELVIVYFIRLKAN